MSMWRKLVDKWLPEPITKVKEQSTFEERGKRFLNEWLLSYFNEESDNIRLSIAVGYCVEEETDTFLGAMLGVTIDDGEMIQLSLPEAAFMCVFLRMQGCRAAQEVMESESLDKYQEAVDGLIVNIQEAIKAAEQFEKSSGTVH